MGKAQKLIYSENSPLMIPNQDRALGLSVLPQGHQPVQVFPALYLELDTDQGVTEVIERTGC